MYHVFANSLAKQERSLACLIAFLLSCAVYLLVFHLSHVTSELTYISRGVEAKPRVGSKLKFHTYHILCLMTTKLKQRPNR